MRVVIVGASGNGDTALLRRLNAEPDMTLSAVVRRVPPARREPYLWVRWYQCDISAPASTDELVRAFAGADAVVHLGWKIQPSHEQGALFQTNVAGSAAVIQAVLRAGVANVVYASTVVEPGLGHLM